MKNYNNTRIMKYTDPVTNKVTIKGTTSNNFTKFLNNKWEILETCECENLLDFQIKIAFWKGYYFEQLV